MSVHDRSLKVATVIESLEMEMELLCLTGVEDQLQADVRPTLEILRNAGIKVKTYIHAHILYVHTVWMYIQYVCVYIICIYINTLYTAHTRTHTHTHTYRQTHPTFTQP